MKIKVFIVVTALLKALIVQSQYLCDQNGTETDGACRNVTNEIKQLPIDNKTSSATIATEQNITLENNLPYLVDNNETVNNSISIYLKDNPDATEIKSPDYPNPYPAIYEQKWSISLKGQSTGVDVTIFDLDLNPSTDFLFIRKGTEENSFNDKGYILTGTNKSIQKFKIISSTELFIHFKSNQPGPEANTNTGFFLTYEPFGEILQPTTEPDIDVTIPPNEIQSIYIFLNLMRDKQNNESLNTFKHILVQSASNYVTQYNLKVEQPQFNNVTFLYVLPCPKSWPENEHCIKIIFGISLWSLSDTNEHKQISDYQLTSEHLWKMWNEFGRYEFSNAGIFEFQTPEFDNTLLIILGSTFSVLIVIMFALLAIWKMDCCKGYQRMKKDYDQKHIMQSQSEFDISMFPSQIVPTLFPSHNETTMSYPNGHFSNGDYMRTNDNELDIHPHIASNWGTATTSFAPNFIDSTSPKKSYYVPDEEISFNQKSQDTTAATVSSPIIAIQGMRRSTINESMT